MGNRIESVKKDNSHSRVRISHGLHKLVTDLIDKKYDDNDQETSTTKTEVFSFARLQQNREDLQLLAHLLQGLHIFLKENGLILNQEVNSIKRTHWQRLNTLRRHGELLREEGGIEFWRLKVDLRNIVEYSQYWSDEMWKSKMAGGGGNKKRFQYCTDLSGKNSSPPSSSRSFRTQSH